MKYLCNCIDWKDIINRKYDLFKYSDNHEKWLLTWIALSKEENTHFVHRYGLVIKYCPFCGKKLTNEANTASK